MHKSISFLISAYLAAAVASPVSAEEPTTGVTFGPYYRISFPLAGEDGNPSWAGGGARVRYEWSDDFAASAGIAYDRYEFDGQYSLAVSGISEPLERQMFTLQGGVIYNIPLRWTYPYAGGGVALAREKTVYRRYAEPVVRWHPGLYGEAGTYIPLVGPLVVDVGSDLTLLLGRRAGDYDRDAGGYQYDSGAAFYLGLKAGVGFFF